MASPHLLPKVAIQNPKYLALATTESGESVPIKQLTAKGYVIAASHAHARDLRDHATVAIENGGKPYLDAVLALPEAADKPATAAKLASAYNLKSMPLAKASLFLSGLPAESAATIEPAKVYSAQQEATFKRRLELHLGGLRLQASRGKDGAKAEAVKVAYAIEICGASNTPPSLAVQMAGVNVNLIRTGASA